VRADAPAATTTARDGSGATSWLYAATLVPCFHLGPTSFCSLGSVGQFVVSAGQDVSSPKSGTSLFAAAGARIGAEIRLSAAFLLRAHVDGLVDLEPPTYEVDGAVLWTAPRLAFSLGVGVAARIP
jgi:hypothetical protein